jgi:hypothetical protein
MSLTEAEKIEGWTDGSPMSGEGTLDRIIGYCQSVGICLAKETIPAIRRDGPLVQVGNIVFYCNSHSTGADVGGWILDGNMAFQFISTTYWYSSTYTFNKSKWIGGAWDGAVNAAIQLLTQKVDEHKQSTKERRAREIEAQARKAAETKAQFERQFAGSQV